MMAGESAMSRYASSPSMSGGSAVSPPACSPAASSMRRMSVPLPSPRRGHFRLFLYGRETRTIPARFLLFLAVAGGRFAMSSGVPCLSTKLRRTFFDHVPISRFSVLPSGPVKMKLYFSRKKKRCDSVAALDERIVHIRVLWDCEAGAPTSVPASTPSVTPTVVPPAHHHLAPAASLPAPLLLWCDAWRRDVLACVARAKHAPAADAAAVAVIRGPTRAATGLNRATALEHAPSPRGRHRPAGRP